MGLMPLLPARVDMLSSDSCPEGRQRRYSSAAGLLEPWQHSNTPPFTPVPRQVLESPVIKTALSPFAGMREEDSEGEDFWELEKLSRPQCQLLAVVQLWAERSETTSVV